MPQNARSSKFWRSITSKIHGRSNSRGRGPEAETEEIEAQEEPPRPGLYLLNERPPLVDKPSVNTHEVDIVAVHGLNGRAFGTWTVESLNEETHEKIYTNWIKDFLPSDIRGARIFTYSYESHVLFSKSRATVNDFAQKLLFALKARRIGQERRPIIFIAHSLGGIVCKQALILAKEDANFRTLLESTVGILFFGTPHRGANNTPDVGIFLGNMFDSLSGAFMARLVVGRTRIDLLESLKANSPDLRRITKSFTHLCGTLQIVTVFETEEMKGLPIMVRRDAHFINRTWPTAYKQKLTLYGIR